MILLHNLLEAPEDEAGDYGLDDDNLSMGDSDETKEEPSETDTDDGVDNPDEQPEDDESDPDMDDDQSDDMTNNIDDEQPADDETDPNTDDNSLSDDDSMTDGSADEEELGSDDDKRKTYILLKSFQKMYNMVDNIITQVERIEFENDYKIGAKNYVMSQLSKSKNLLYDYITITFKTMTYEENLIFIENYKDNIKTLIKTLKKVQESNS